MKQKVDVFLAFPRFLHDSMNVGKLISGSSAISNPSVHLEVLGSHTAKPSLKGFEHNLASM